MPILTSKHVAKPDGMKGVTSDLVLLGNHRIATDEGYLSH